MMLGCRTPEKGIYKLPSMWMSLPRPGLEEVVCNADFSSSDEASIGYIVWISIAVGHGQTHSKSDTALRNA